MLYLVLILCLGAIWFYCFSIYGAIDFFSNSYSHPQRERGEMPPVTIIKPVCGLDWEIEENLVSFCQQDYPEYQVIFGVQERGDLSLDVVKEIIEKFPNLDLSFTLTETPVGNNLKVSNLATAEAKAKYEILVIADSDIRVNKDYLKRVVQPMGDPEVGLVTCLYNSLTQGGVASFEALEISTLFAARVLTARKLDGIKFAFGSTIVIRRAVLTEIGGFVAVADYLADDYQLGNLTAKIGKKVVLSDYVVTHSLAGVSLREFLKRQIRWAKCIRVERFWGYLGLIFTQGTVTSLFFLLLTWGSFLGWLVLGVTWGMRLLMAWVVGVKFLQDSVAKNWLWLVFFRDMLSFGIWVYSLVGNKIEWRGRQFKLITGGKLVKLD